MALKPPNFSQKAQISNKIQEGSIVEYENHGKPMLSIVIQEVKDKFDVLNSSGKQVKFPANRLYLYPGQIPKNLNSASEKTKFLEDTQNKADEIKSTISLEELWQKVNDKYKEISVLELTEIGLKENSATNHIAMRHALLNDTVFFKRKKQNYQPRPAQIVEELKKKERVEREKREKQESLIEAIVQNIKGNKLPFPSSIEILEQVAAHGKNCSSAKEGQILLEEISKRTQLELSGRLEHRAFFILESAGHFDKNQDLNLYRYNRKIYFESSVLEEARQLIENLKLGNNQDLQNITCVTIDSASTKDFDDAISCEEKDNSYLLGIHISQVADIVQVNSRLEKEIFYRGSSIYCADRIIPMLPEEISAHALSLVEGEPRPALSFFIEISKDDAEVVSTDIKLSIIKVQKRLSFDDVNDMLYDRADIGSQDIQDLVYRLWQASSELETKRMMKGAIQFSRREMLAKLESSGKVSLEIGSDDTPAHKLVGEFMILANEVGALYARDNKIPLIFRTQEAPDVDVNNQGVDVPDGPAREFFKRGFLKRSLLSASAMLHSSLGLDAYAQLTSPLRRVADYINQKQLISFIKNQKPFYSEEEIKTLIDQTENKVTEVFQIQRQRNRFWLLKYLQQEKIKEIKATVVKVDGPKQLAELDIIYTLYPFASANQEKKKLGDQLFLRIEKIDPRNDRIVLSEKI